MMADPRARSFALTQEPIPINTVDRFKVPPPLDLYASGGANVPPIPTPLIASMRWYETS